MSPHKHHPLTNSDINIMWRSSFDVHTKLFIGRGVTSRISSLIVPGTKTLLLRQAREQKSDLLTTELSKLNGPFFEMVLPDSEACKSSSTLLTVWQKLQELGFGRADTIVAFGGGALSDLAGFAAGTYLRGINLINIPTTLLAQVDAAIGGKTAINLTFGKNLAGIVYFPKAILIDAEMLATLPERQLSSGLAEVIKYALLEDTIAAETEYLPGPLSFLTLLENELIDEKIYSNPICDGVITSSIKMKLSVVAKDPLEGNLRRCLNLGHTLGHALEQASQHTLTHGEAVAIGMVFATELSSKLGLIAGEEVKRVVALLERVGLPTRAPGSLSIEDVQLSLFHDKKRQKNEFQLILPTQKLGKVDYSYKMGADELVDQIGAFLNERLKGAS
jgi:3-dehydroquinate synthase